MPGPLNITHGSRIAEPENIVSLSDFSEKWNHSIIGSDIKQKTGLSGPRKYLSVILFYVACH